MDDDIEMRNEHPHMSLMNAMDRTPTPPSSPEFAGHQGVEIDKQLPPNKNKQSATGQFSNDKSKSMELSVRFQNYEEHESCAQPDHTLERCIELFDEGPQEYNNMMNEASPQKYQGISIPMVEPPSNKEGRQGRNSEQGIDHENYREGVTAEIPLDKLQENIPKSNTGKPMEGIVSSQEQQMGFEQVNEDPKLT
ncbi:hypothetical protein QAD02_013290 [Eretmocerus hayati]|uniref:Uncharacterized protein n=1 Tax=Eretmocerus hayati TaxID=131215 RepID=A0ACC2P324_9HYME|nr:hypothetical protein QAD02_013290 [Eretmocerus hayati]